MSRTLAEKVTDEALRNNIDISPYIKHDGKEEMWIGIILFKLKGNKRFSIMKKRIQRAMQREFGKDVV